METKMTKMDKVLKAIFDWGHGFGGLLFMIFVASPVLGALIAVFLTALIFGFDFLGLI